MATFTNTSDILKQQSGTTARKSVAKKGLQRASQWMMGLDKYGEAHKRQGLARAARAAFVLGTAGFGGGLVGAGGLVFSGERAKRASEITVTA